MQEIRQGFHELRNQLNNISIPAGVVVETAKLKDIDSMSEGEIKEAYKKALEALSLAENSAIKAGEIISRLTKRIYSELKIDTSKPIE